MYSVVLMTALTAGSATPAWHHCGGGGHCGYHGGYGGGCAHCGGGYGGGYEGCGCWGGYSSWGYCAMPPPNAIVPYPYGMATGGAVAPGTGSGNEEPEKPKTNKKDKKAVMIPTHAKLVIDLPINAKLFIDDSPVKAAAGVQTFDTPALEPGKDYFYLVRIEMMRDGQPLSQTRRLIVRAGQVARADFKDLEPEGLRTAQVK